MTPTPSPQSPGVPSPRSPGVPFTTSVASNHPDTVSAANHHRDPSVEALLVKKGRHLVELTGKVVTEISHEQLGQLGVFCCHGACRVRIDQDIRQIPEWQFGREGLLAKHVQRGEGDSS